MIIFLHGEDAFLVGRRKRLLMEAFRTKNPGSEVFTFDFEDDRTPENVRRALLACEGGLFAEKKMVVMIHPFLLEEDAEDALRDFLKGEVLTQYPENVYLFVAPGKIKKAHALTKIFAKIVDTTEELPSFMVARGSKKVPDVPALLTFAKKELKRQGMSFGAGAAEYLVEATGADAAKLVSEIEKLATYKGEGTIEKNDVQVCIGVRAEADIFRALDALSLDNKEETLKLMRLAARGEDIYGALALCAWQVRRMLMIREVVDRGQSNAYDIARELKMPPFLVEKSLRSIRRFPLARLRSGLTLLADLDLELKQGQVAPEIALDTFIWKF